MMILDKLAQWDQLQKDVKDLGLKVRIEDQLIRLKANGNDVAQFNEVDDCLNFLNGWVAGRAYVEPEVE